MAGVPAAAAARVPASRCLSPAGRKAAHRLLATALSDRGYAQAMAIIALEEVLDRAEGWRARPAQRRLLGERLRRPGRRRAVVVAVRGAPPVGDDDRAGRRGLPCAALPRRQPCLRPLRRPCRLPAARPRGRPGPRAARRARAGRAGRPPSSPTRRPPTSAPAPGPGPSGHRATRHRRASRLGPDRAARCSASSSRSTWTGCPPSWPPGRLPGSTAASCTSPGRARSRRAPRHYYRVQGDDLLIEYDNTTDDGNHAHTVLRRPRSDFGDDVLAAHYSDAHPPAS